MTKIEIWQISIYEEFFLKGSFSKNILTPWQPRRCSLGSVLRFSRCFFLTPPPSPLSPHAGYLPEVGFSSAPDVLLDLPPLQHLPQFQPSLLKDLGIHVCSLIFEDHWEQASPFQPAACLFLPLSLPHLLPLLYHLLTFFSVTRHLGSEIIP